MIHRKVLLIGWDAADWKVIHSLMVAGGMPNLRRLVEAGASGSIATLHPPLSPMLWTSIATGKRPFRHGVLGFAEPTPNLDSIRPVSNLSRKTKAVWNILNQNGLRSIVVGWWPSHPAEPINGVMVSDHFHRAFSPVSAGWPLPPGSVHPATLASHIATLRVHPDMLAPEMVEQFVPLASEIDQERDHRLGLLMRTLAEFQSVASTSEWLLEHQPWDFFAVYFDSIDHFCHSFMKYHPPRQQRVSPRDFELYQHVVAAAYEMHDRLLGSLLEKAGAETSVVLLSDHGFHPDHLRPVAIPEIPAGPAIEHRRLGILAIAGPGVRRGTTLTGASLLDIAPTILAMYGLPSGQDMDGKILSRALSTPPQQSSIPSWDDVPGDDGQHPPHTRIDAVAAHESLAQLVALGYIEKPDENRRAAVERTIRELEYNLGESLQDAGRHREAHALFTHLCAADPDEQRFAVRLFASCQALGLDDEMRSIVQDLDGRRRGLFETAAAHIRDLRQQMRTKSETASADEMRDLRRELAYWRRMARYHPALVDYLKAQLLTRERRYSQALTLLESISESHLMRPGVLLETADLYVKLGRLRDAARLCRKALAIEPENEQAQIALCRIALRRKHVTAAARYALAAVESAWEDPVPHFLLGRALAGSRQYTRAVHALLTAISLNPNFPQAHEYLARLLQRLGDSDAAQEHRQFAEQMRNGPGSSPYPPAPEISSGSPGQTALPGSPIDMPPPGESVTVVTGLPRSGTSMLMQMLAAGGVPVLTDRVREADEDNPRGYLEFEPVKTILSHSEWLTAARGKAVKIVAPLLSALPADLPCRVILVDRDLDEVLDSQERMLARLDPERVMTPERREILRSEFARTLERIKRMPAERAQTRLLIINHRDVIRNPLQTAETLRQFLEYDLDLAGMAAAVDPALHRNRHPHSATAASR